MITTGSVRGNHSRPQAQHFRFQPPSLTSVVPPQWPQQRAFSCHWASARAWPHSDSSSGDMMPCMASERRSTMGRSFSMAPGTCRVRCSVTASAKCPWPDALSTPRNMASASGRPNSVSSSRENQASFASVRWALERTTGLRSASTRKRAPGASSLDFQEIRIAPLGSEPIEHYRRTNRGHSVAPRVP